MTDMTSYKLTHFKLIWVCLIVTIFPQCILQLFRKGNDPIQILHNLKMDYIISELSQYGKNVIKILCRVEQQHNKYN